MPDPALDVARSLGVPTQLIPVLIPLFANLQSLGAAPKRTASVLARAHVTRHSRVIDLGCGKGTVSVEIARRFGCRVTGIDACPEFLSAAVDLARSKGVHRLCTFRHGSIPRALRDLSSADVAIMLNLFPFAKAAPLLRSLVKPGGLYLFDDALRDPRHPRAARHANVPTAADVLAAVNTLGDRVLRRVTIPRAAIASQSRHIHRLLAASTQALGRDHPRLRPTLRAFLSGQTRAAQTLQGPLRPTLWLVQRGQ